MHLALSTLGCPELTLADAARRAARHGFTGLEVRSAPGLETSADASPEQRRQWRDALRSAGCAAVSVASYVRLCDRTRTDDEVRAAGLADARLAHDLGVPWLRVFPGGPRGHGPDPALDDLARRRLAHVVADAERLGVAVALETHDSHPRVQDVLRVVDTPGCGAHVVWDVLHTWLGGEPPARSLELAADRLAYVQLKDVAGPQDLAPLPLGHGVLPLPEVAALLRGQPGWASWEYERAWHPGSPPLFDLAEDAAAWCRSRLG